MLNAPEAVRMVWNDELMATRWDRLCDGQGNTVSDAVTEHDPQLWAVWLDEVELYEDSRTGEEVDEGDIDWDIDAADHDDGEEDQDQQQDAGPLQRAPHQKACPMPI